jgi:serine/threonine protein kinase
LGMTMLEISTGKIPFSQKKNDSSVIFYVLEGGRPELPDFLKNEDSLRSLVQECWASNPDARPTSRAVHDILDTNESSATSSVEMTNPSWIRSWL